MSKPQILIDIDDIQDEVTTHKAEIATKTTRGHIMTSEIPALWKLVQEIKFTNLTATIDIALPSEYSEFRITGTEFSAQNSGQMFCTLNNVTSLIYKYVLISNGVLSALTAYTNNILISSNINTQLSYYEGLEFDILFNRNINSVNPVLSNRPIFKINSLHSAYKMDVVYGFYGYTQLEMLTSIQLKALSLFKSGNIKVWGR